MMYVAGLTVLLVCAGTIHGATLRTGDGLALELDETTGTVSGLAVGKEKVPLLPNVQGGFYIVPVSNVVKGEQQAVHVSVGNLLANPGFEGGKDPQGLPVGWECDNRERTLKFVTVDEAVAHSGKASLKVTPDPEGKPMTGMYQWIPLEKDKMYRFSGWVKSDLKGTKVLIALSYTLRRGNGLLRSISLLRRQIGGR